MTTPERTLDLCEGMLRRTLKDARPGRACAIGFLRTPSGDYGLKGRETLIEDPPAEFLNRLGDIGLELKPASIMTGGAILEHERLAADFMATDLYLIRVVWSSDQDARVEQIFDGGSRCASAWTSTVRARGSELDIVEQSPTWER